MAQKTAIQQAIDKLNSKIFAPRSNIALGVTMAINILKELEVVEKEQIIHAFDTACEDQDRIGKEYYKETYQ